MVPKSNVEYFLQAIIENSDTPFEAKSRIERYITDILEERVSTLEPVFRIEYYLAKISGADVELPEPISRADLYLAALAGEEVTLPDTPNSSLEEYLARWCETGNAVLTITGNPVRFTGMTNTQIQALSVNLRPIQDLHGYSNPWPAGGGKNLLDSATVFADTAIYTVNADESVTMLQTNGQSWMSTTVVGIPLEAGTYTFSRSNASGAVQIRKSSNNYTTNILNLSNEVSSGSFTLTSADTIKIKPNTGSTAVYPNTSFFQLELGSTATDWTPYENICPISGSTGLSVYVSPTQDLADATTYTEDWTSQAGTVYGGTLDIVTGVLTVDREMVDMGTMAWNKAGSGYYSTSINKVAKKGSATYGYDNAISSQYESVSIHSIAGLPNFGLSVDIGGNVQLKDSRYATAAELKSGLDGVQLCYELATPLTYQLTPQEVESLLGVNNIWSDSGDVTVVLKNAETYEEVANG